jgi:hypothetical protein
MQINDWCTWITQSHSKITIECKGDELDERGCFGSAQCAHKNVKSPRERAKSRPPSIYRHTPSKRVVGLLSTSTDVAPGVWHSEKRHMSMCLKSNGHAPHTSDAYIARMPGRLSHWQTLTNKLHFTKTIDRHVRWWTTRRASRLSLLSSFSARQHHHVGCWCTASIAVAPARPLCAHWEPWQGSVAPGSSVWRSQLEQKSRFCCSTCFTLSLMS